MEKDKIKELNVRIWELLERHGMQKEAVIFCCGLEQWMDGCEPQIREQPDPGAALGQPLHGMLSAKLHGRLAKLFAEWSDSEGLTQGERELRREAHALLDSYGLRAMTVMAYDGGAVLDVFEASEAPAVRSA